MQHFTSIWGLFAITSVLVIHRLSSFTYSAMKVLEHDVRP